MLNRFRLQTKLFLYYSSVVFIILALALTSFNYYISSILEQRAKENLMQLTAKTSGQVDNLLIEMDRIALYAISNPLIKEVFSGIEKPEAQTNFFESNIDENRRVMYTLISINLPNNNSAFRTSLYNLQGDYISMGIPDSPQTIKERTQSFNYSKWYKSLMVNNSKRLLPPHNDFWSDDKNLQLISLTREITDPGTSTSYGIVEVQLPYNKLQSLLAPAIPSHPCTYLLDGTGAVVYPLVGNDEIQVSDFYLKSIGNKTAGSIKLKNPLSKKVELITFNKSSFSAWTLVMSEEENALLSPVRLIGLITLFTGLGLLIITLIIVFFLTNLLTKPLKLLRNSVKEVSLDNLSLNISHSKNNNEITELNIAFNTMFARLKESMNELVQTRSHEMKAHMIALQSQMDPHFLYNMLSIITASSREIGASKITEICQKLSGMFRYITSYQEDFVPIKDEIEHAASYLMLMKIRYEDQFEYEISVDDSVYNSKTDIPKLTLQPLVENCFQHGFRNILPPWRLTVKADCKEDGWYIEVSDNGIGIEEDKIRKLFNQVDEFIKNPSTNIKDLKLGGMGLINTLVRMKLLYKDNIILDVRSSYKCGTKITIGGTMQ